MKFGTLFLVIGPSGAGKRTLINLAILALLSIRWFVTRLVSYTTRRQTESEVNHVDYHFVDAMEFANLESVGFFLETNDPYGRGRYGTPTRDLVSHLSYSDVILEVDVNGMRSVKANARLCGMGVKIITIFIIPPSVASLETRLTDRKRDSDDEIRTRINRATEELFAAKECDHQLVNHEGEQKVVAVQLVEIIQQHGVYGESVKVAMGE